MRVKGKIKMSWEEAPDIITPGDLAKILDVGIENARKIFDEPDFPKISKDIIGNIGRADKEAARMYIQGVKINKNNTKESLLGMIYYELKRINSTEEFRMEKSEKMRIINIRKFKTRIYEFITILITLILTILSICQANLIRGYKAVGGEYFVPIFGILLILIIEDIYERGIHNARK